MNQGNIEIGRGITRGKRCSLLSLHLGMCPRGASPFLICSLKIVWILLSHRTKLLVGHQTDLARLDLRAQLKISSTQKMKSLLIPQISDRLIMMASDVQASSHPCSP